MMSKQTTLEIPERLGNTSPFPQLAFDHLNGDGIPGLKCLLVISRFLYHYTSRSALGFTAKSR